MAVNPLAFLQFDKSNLTPEELAYQKQLAAAMMPSGRARNVGEGIAEIGKGIVAGILLRKVLGGQKALAAEKKANEAKGNALFETALSGLTGGQQQKNAGPQYPVSNAAEKSDFGKDAVPAGGVSGVRKALLDAIAGKESAGRYDVIYGGERIADYSRHPEKYVPIRSGPNKGKKTSAAGRYQFLASTWKHYAKKLGLKDFSPASQDKAAWALAADTYKAKTGEDLETALRSGDPANIAQVGKVLSGVWTSLPGGIEQGQGTNAFVSAFNRALGGAGGEASIAPAGGSGAPQPVSVRLAQADTGAQTDAAPVQITPVGGGVKDESRILPDGTEYADQQFSQQTPAQDQQIDPRIIRALASPYVSEDKKALLRQLLEYKMKQSSGPNTVVIGNKLVDRRTGRVLGDYTQEPAQTAMERQYELARKQGFNGSFLDYQIALKRAGKPETKVNVNTGGAEFPGLSKLPPGYTYKYGPDGKPIVDENGVPQVVPIPGTKEAKKAADVKAYEGVGQVYKDTMTDTIRRAISMLDDKQAGIPITGNIGTVAALIGQTRAADFSGLIDTIKANIGFERLDAMRKASPTGGALGQVTERELGFLQATLGKLDPRTIRPETLKRTLQDTLNSYRRMQQIIAFHKRNPNATEEQQREFLRSIGVGLEGAAVRRAQSGGGWQTLPNGIRIRKVK